MKRIIFVDDEPGILQGLRNALRKQRTRWDMVFVDSGAAALLEMRTSPFDVVVSDMRMPQMDGAQLLTRVREEHPSAARVVLSGHAEHEAILRALPAAHQFLSKPCSPTQLEEVIERTCGLQALLHSGTVRSLAAGLDRLPSLPHSYQALRQAVARADVSVAEIVRIVEHDPAMCAKILQLVNSAYFGLPRKVTSVQQAVTFLGLELVKALALSAQVFATMDSAPVTAPCLESIQQHSVCAARLAREFAVDAPLTDDAFTTALVHDIGKIVMAVAGAVDYEAVDEQARRSGLPCHVVEQEMFGASHAEVGAYLLGIWGLPAPVVEAVAFHHRPTGVAQPSRLLAVLHAADVLAEDICLRRPASLSNSALDHAMLESAGVAAEVPRWIRIAETHREALS